MNIESLIKKFWQGKIKLWQSFWLVGAIGGFIIGRIIILIEDKIFENKPLFPIDFTFRSKFLILIWSIYTTIGIWRSAENYKGSPLIRNITKIYIVLNFITTLYVFFFFNF